MSAALQNEDKPSEDHYEGTDINGGMSIYDQFASELDKRADSISSMLPSTVTLARFKNTVVAAVRQDPSILNATIRSIMGAVIRAAQDGLVPDGREGHIAVYNVNAAKKGEKDRWEKRAQWNPMAGGLRKRLRELDNIIANAEVVHEKDHFVWHQGDDPKIEHEPAKLGTDRGKMVGAYCIYRKGDDILHREVMDCTQIETTRTQSKQPNSLMWSKFPEEGYRKVVLRRGIKTVPVTDQMRDIVQRDDIDNFEFERRTEAAAVLTPPPAPPPAPKAIEQKPSQMLPDPPKTALEPVPAGASAKAATSRRKAGEPRQEPARTPASVAAEEIGGPPSAYDDWLADTKAELAECDSQRAVEDLRDRALNDLEDADVADWKDACAARAAELAGASA